MLALTLETSLVTLIACAVATTFLLLITKNEWGRFAVVVGLISIATILISIVQGGVLSTTGGETGASSFAFNFDGKIHYHHGATAALSKVIALWEWKFFREFGIHLALFVASGIYFVRKKKIDGFLILLFLCAAAHFLIPLFIRFTPRLHEMNRFFFVFFGTASLVCGIYLWETCLKQKASKVKFIFGSILVVLMLTAGTLNASARLFLPSLNIERAPLFPTMPEISEDERLVNEWVRENTTIEDYFFLHAGNTTDERWKNRVSFISHTGRFSIGFGFEDAKPEFKEIMDNIEESCNSDLMRQMEIKYLLIQTEPRANWFASQCTKSDWKRVYDGGNGTREYPQIFQLLPLFP